LVVNWVSSCLSFFLSASTCKKEYISIQRGDVKLRKPSILIVNWVSSYLSFFLSSSTAATYIFTAPNCTTTIIGLEPCALNCWWVSAFHFISYWGLLKCLYFADTIERGDRRWKKAQRKGEEKVTLRITHSNLCNPTNTFCNILCKAKQPTQDPTSKNFIPTYYFYVLLTPRAPRIVQMKLVEGTPKTKTWTRVLLPLTGIITFEEEDDWECFGKEPPKAQTILWCSSNWLTNLSCLW
jgi:hypothetical protein